MSGKNVMRALAGTAGVLLVAGAAAPGAGAAVRAEDSGDVQATVRKTVLQTATASGEVLTSRMYTQVSAVGAGTKTVTVPVGVDSNRNLNDFGPFPMEGQSIVFELDVDGNVEERTLTDADISPMEVSVKVMLDGVEVEPEDLVGKDGVVDVQYTVRNTTVRMEEVTFADVEGNEVTESIEVAEPYGGSLDITLPKGFNEISAPGAVIAGDGRNSTSLGYSLVLFPPLGSPEVTVGYQARMADGQMPAAVFSFLPIIPLDNSTAAGAYEAYKGGASTGASIFDAGVQIGDNLLKLQEGAGQLVAGLGQLSAGASQLSDGLVNTAAPGSAALADGANQVSDGLSQLNENVPALEDGVEQLDDGANQLSDGLNQLESNVPALSSGVSQLNGGAQQLSGGLGQLKTGIDTLSKGVAALPDSIKQNPGYQQLQGALKGVQDAIDAKFIPGINQLEKGLDNADPADPGFKQVLGALYDKLYKADPDEPGARQALQSISYALGDTAPTATLTAGGVLRIVTTLQTVLDCQALDPAPAPGITGTCTKVPPDAVAGLPAGFTANFYVYSLLGGIRQIIGGAGADGTVLFGLNEIITQIGDGSPPTSPTEEPTATFALNALIAGIGSKSDFPPADPTKPPETLLYGLEALKAGLSNPNCKATDPTNAANPCGVREIQGLVSAGINQLVAGISAELMKGIGTTPVNPATCSPTTLTCASAQLAAGGSQLATGTSQLNAQVPTLAEGIEQLAAGGEQLADGTGELNAAVPELASGVEQLDDGAAQVADGADQLADGLGAAADGSEQLADGLGQAEPGGAQIEAGAGQLKEEGADVVAESGKNAQLGFARDVALIEAVQQMGVEGSNLPFGPAEGTDVTTTAAIQMQLAGIAADTENNALTFGLGALLIAGAGGIAFAARRKMGA
jgi:putative membrane protein